MRGRRLYLGFNSGFQKISLQNGKQNHLSAAKLGFCRPAVWYPICSSTATRGIEFLTLKNRIPTSGKQDQLRHFVDSSIWGSGRSSSSDERIEIQTISKFRKRFGKQDQLRHFVDSSIWAPGRSSCSDEKDRNSTESQNSESDLASKKGFATSWILRFGLLVARAAATKRIEIRQNLRIQKAIWRARSASPLRGFFDLGFWSLKLQ
jgi:hypothetical protein